jgi:hypothetical protein
MKKIEHGEIKIENWDWEMKVGKKESMSMSCVGKNK